MEHYSTHATYLNQGEFMRFGNMASLMQQATKLQKAMKEVEDKFVEEEFTGSAGGAVTVTISGKLDIKSIEVDDSLITPADKSMLLDLIAAAFNSAKTNAETEKSNRMKALTGGLNLPPGLGL